MMRKATSVSGEKTQEENPYRISYEGYMNTNACTECTGLIMRPNQGDEEWENYLDVFDFRPEEEDKI